MRTPKFVLGVDNLFFRSFAFGIMTLISCVAIASPKSQPLGKDTNAQHHAIDNIRAAKAEDISTYAAMIRHASRQGADELALFLAKKSIELEPDAVLLRIILAKLFIQAKNCSNARPHLKYAADLIDPQSDDPSDRRYRSVINRMLNICSAVVENVAFMSLKGQRSASLLDRRGENIVPIDQGSLLDRYCDALGPLCAHHGRFDVNKNDRGGTSIWIHMGTISRVRTFDVWTPSIQANVFRKLNSKPHFGLQGAKVQLDMKRSIGKNRRFDASFSAQSVIAQQGAGKPKLTHEALHMGLAIRHFVTKRTNIGTGIAQTRTLQNLRHSKRFETDLEFTTKITNYLKAEAGATWAITSRKGGALSSQQRDLNFGISMDLSPWVFAGASLRQTKIVFNRPLIYLRAPHQVARREFATNVGFHLTKDKTSMIDFHFVRTSSVSHYTPDNFKDDAVIVYFQHIF